MDLRIRFLDKYVQIFAQRGEIGIFEKLPEVHEAKFLIVSGNVTRLKLLKVDGGPYKTSPNVTFSLGNDTRFDLLLQPLPEVNPDRWEALIEGKYPPSQSAGWTRTKRKSSGGGRGGSHSRSSSSHGASHSHSSGGGYGSSSFHGYTLSSHRSSYHSSSSSHSNSYGKPQYGVYWFSPPVGGYYTIPHSPNKNANNTHVYTPASYSYRWNGSTHYSPSEGHGLKYDPSFVVDKGTLPKPKRIDILLYVAKEAEMTPAWVVSFRFTERSVVLNTYDGHWKDEDRADFMPIDDWRLVDLVIWKYSSKMHIFINNYEFATYNMNTPLYKSNTMRITGDLEILGVKMNDQETMETRHAPLLRKPSHSRHKTLISTASVISLVIVVIALAGLLIASYFLKETPETLETLINGTETQETSGRLGMLTSSTKLYDTRSNGHNATNREEWSPTFKLSFRFDLNTTTLSRFDGGWVDEEKADFLPIDDWRLFDLAIRPANHKLYIYINNYEFASYKLSSEIMASDYLGIEGDVEILGLKEDGLLA
ncbi:unnamed protein product, partial [Mesorhabditis spiculigera]